MQTPANRKKQLVGCVAGGFGYVVSVLVCMLLLVLLPCVRCCCWCLQEYCPEAAELPTTNGPWATGDGIQLGAGLGAAFVGMEHVQVGGRAWVCADSRWVGVGMC